MKNKIHDHTCTNCFADQGPCTGECNVYDENRALAARLMQEYFPDGGRNWDEVLSLYDAIYAGKIPGVVVSQAQLNPPRGEMLEYIKAAIGEGYQPEHESAIIDLAVIDTLSGDDLNREYGKCWQWYNMGGGIQETFEKKVSFKDIDRRRDEKYDAFANAAEPLMKYMAENWHPHTTAIVDSTSAELLCSEMSHLTEKFLVD